MLLALTCVLKSGMQIFHIQGPVGSGKSIAIREFCLLYSLRFAGNILIISAQNAPCNKFTEDMLDAAKVANNINLTRLASQGEAAKQRKLNSNVAECIAAAGDRTEY
eukprot:8965448-Karenia_brevis.AAC.1